MYYICSSYQFIMPMKPHYFTITMIFILFFLFISKAQTTTFDFTGSMQTYTVPSGVTLISIEAWGAQGGTDDGGMGGYATGMFNVTQGQTLNIFVGGQGSTVAQSQGGSAGGWNGGGRGGSGGMGASGGGASDVRVGGTTLNDRIIVGGGGGGMDFEGTYNYVGGHGGGLIGNSSTGDVPLASGGTQSLGGLGAADGSYPGENGSFGLGGGNGFYEGTTYEYGGGGGGGYYGGGGGHPWCSGAGGSSYIGGVTNGSTIAGMKTGNGQVKIHVANEISINAQPEDNELLCDDTIAVFSCHGDFILNYQWQESTDNGLSWSDLSESTTYIDVAADTLTVIASQSMNLYQYRCMVSNDFLNDSTDAAVLTFIVDTIAPSLVCVATQNISIEPGETFYVVAGNEFDPVTATDNCEISSLINDFNSLSTLDAAQIPIGTTIIIWTATDPSSNEQTCSTNVIVTPNTVIQELMNGLLHIYPNPFINFIQIDVSDSFIDRIVITEMTGKVIFEKMDFQNEVTIDLSNISSGMYILTVFYDNTFSSMLITKE